MLCVSLAKIDIEQAIKAIKDHDMAEVRLDLSGFGKDEILQLIQLERDLIFTFRKNENNTDHKRLDLLIFAIQNGAAWVDVDLDNEAHFIQSILEEIQKQKKTKLIISYHNFHSVPTNQKLFDVLIKAKSLSADLVKIACFSHGSRDNERILPFNKHFENVIAFNMGNKGTITRVRCLFEGALFSYVALEGALTAEGQLDTKTMKKMINIEKNRFNYER
jgi:3-dehydroquinate dehydratase type I